MDDVAWGEVFTGGIIRTLRKAANQLLKYLAHIVVGDRLGAEVGLSDLLHDLVEQIGIVELADELIELEVLEDLIGIFGEALDVGFEVVLNARFTQL